MGSRTVFFPVKRPVSISFVVHDLTKISTFGTVIDPGRMGAENEDLRYGSVGYMVQDQSYVDDQKSNIIRNFKVSTTSSAHPQSISSAYLIGKLKTDFALAFSSPSEDEEPGLPTMACFVLPVQAVLHLDKDSLASWEETC